MVFLRGRVLDRLDRRIRLHVPVEVAGAGEGRQQDAHRRAALRTRASRRRRRRRRRDRREPEITAWMVSPAPCVPNDLDLEIVLLEDAGVLAERRRLVLPVVDLADRDLQRVLRRSRRGAEREQRRARSASCEASSLPPFGFSCFRFDACSALRAALPGPAVAPPLRPRAASDPICRALPARRAAAPSIRRRARAARARD